MDENRATLQDLPISPSELPSYIVIEGPIGVGKSTLCKLLAETFEAGLLLEDAEANPFLNKFYAGEKNAALATQLFFLMQRNQQMQQLLHQDIFHRVLVADFLLDKTQLFAELTLNADEMALYHQVSQHLTGSAPTPDLVIYLQAPVEVLLKRIQKRGIESERHIDAEYLHRLNDAYSRFFHFYEDAPLLIVNASDLDWANRIEDYNDLVRFLVNSQKGRNYYNPHSNL